MSEREERWSKRLDVPVLVATAAVIPVIVLEQTNVSDGWKTLGTVLNWAIWTVFVVELFLLLSVTDSRSRWLREHPLELAIVVLTPPFLPSSLQAARLLRLARVLRLMRLAQLSHRLFTLDGLRWAGVLAAMTVLGGGAAFSAAEGSGVSTWDGVWWAFVTLTTVGYGDIYPKTDLGRLVAVGVMTIGIGFVAFVTAALAERFLRVEIHAEAEHVAQEVEMSQADVLTELDEIARRLQRVEAAVRAMAS